MTPLRYMGSKSQPTGTVIFSPFFHPRSRCLVGTSTSTLSRVPNHYGTRVDYLRSLNVTNGTGKIVIQGLDDTKTYSFNIGMFNYTGATFTRSGWVSKFEGACTVRIAKPSSIQLWAPALYDMNAYDRNRLRTEAVAIADSNEVTHKGAVRVFDLNNNGAWAKRGETIEGEKQDDAWGSSGVGITADGNTIVAGAIFNDGDSSSLADNRGHARVYEWKNSSWTQVGSDVDGDTGDHSGWDVSIHKSGSLLAVSSQAEGKPLRLYRKDNDAWTLTQTVASGSIASMAIAGDGDHLVAATGSTFSVYELDNNAIYVADVTKALTNGNDATESCSYGMIGRVTDSGEVRFQAPAAFVGDTAFAAPAKPAEQTSISLWVNIPSVAEVQQAASTSGLRQDMYLAGYEFSDKNLQNADAKRSDLKGCVLVGSDLRNADLRYARLTQEHITRDVTFMRTNPATTIRVDRHVPMMRAVDGGGLDANRTSHLANVDLTGADLRNADLRGADLSSATYDSTTQFAGAIYDDETLWKDATVTAFPQDFSTPARGNNNRGTPPTGARNSVSFTSYGARTTVTMNGTGTAAIASGWSIVAGANWAGERLGYMARAMMGRRGSPRSRHHGCRRELHQRQLKGSILRRTAGVTVMDEFVTHDWDGSTMARSRKSSTRIV